MQQGQNKGNDWFNEALEAPAEDSEEAPSESGPTPSGSNYDFKVEETTESNPKVVITVAGEKGEGKTMTAMSFIRKDKTMAVIQFDENAAPIKKHFYKNTDRIKVYSGIKYMNNDAEHICEGGYKTIKYLEFLLTEFLKEPENKRPHYVVIDGFEILATIAEFAMRYNNRKKPFEGIKNANLWKERRGYLKQIHNLARQVAQEGIIYTVYMDQVDTLIEEGQVQSRKTEPKWMDVIKWETHIILHSYTVTKDGKKVFLVDVLSSKLPNLLVTGKRYDVTGKPLMMKDMTEVGVQKKDEKIEEDTSSPKKVVPPPSKPVEKEQKAERPELEIKKPKKTITKLPPDTKETEKPGHEETDVLTDPTGKCDDVVEEIVSQQNALKKKTDDANAKSEKKSLETSTRVIMETINSDFPDQQVMVTKLKEKVMSVGVISAPAFDKAMTYLLDNSGELYAPRMGYVSKVKEQQEESESEPEPEQSTSCILSDQDVEDVINQEVTPPKTEVVQKPQPKTVTKQEKQEASTDEFERW